MNVQGQFKKLFEPGRIGTLELKNRIVMPPMSTNFPTVWGEATEVMANYFKARAKGGAALLFLEVTQTATAIDLLKQLPCSLRLDDDGFGPALVRVVESVHESGSKVGIQLSPGFSSQARIGPWIVGQQHVNEVISVSPSGVIHPEVKRPSRELAVSQIEKIIELLGLAAARAKAVGFDIIEIHGHSGFLIGQFLSPYFNRRTDKYGGSLENRFRFLREIIESARLGVGESFPLTVKFSIDEFFEGGRGLKEGLEIARELEKAGINGITVSRGIHGVRQHACPSMYSPDGAFIPLSEALKEVVSIPVILPGKMGDPYLAEKVLEEGKADFVGWGRPLIADPELPTKIAEGRLEEIRWCIHCNECLHVQWANRSPLRCTVNPVAGRELEYSVIRPTESKKKVIVIGAGPAGMETARVAALRGHNVVLYERSHELGGGQLKLASMPPYKDKLKRLVDYYDTSFKKLSNVKVVLGKEATAKEILKDNGDVVVLANGGDALLPDMPGVDKVNVITAHRLLSNQVAVGETVLIVGGGSVGCEVAHFLAKQGKKVTVVEMLDELATDVQSWLRIELLSELREQGINLLTGVKVVSVRENGVEGVDRESRLVRLKADTVVFALGAKSNDELAKNLVGKVRELHIIGDAKQPRRIRNAVSEGYIVGFNI